MGTRGAFGYVGTVEGEELTKVTYNHWDSYPSVLGCKIVNYIKGKSFDDMRKDFSKIQLVSEEDTPAKEQVEECSLAETTNTDVGGQSEEDWYCLLRGAQGDLDKHANVGYMIDSQVFLYDSLFCEWAYILNMDTKELEIYRGFQKDKNKVKGRYGDNDWFIDRLKGMDGFRAKPKYTRVLAAAELYGLNPKYYGVTLIKTIPFNEVTEKLMKEIEQDECGSLV
jgi:hypothetical protein